MLLRRSFSFVPRRLASTGVLTLTAFSLFAIIFFISSENNYSFNSLDFWSEIDDIYLKHNIWNVSETFLRTPFFDGNAFICHQEFKFQQFLSPVEAGNETINMNDIPNANLEEFYFQTKDNINCLSIGSNSDLSYSEGRCLCLYETENGVTYFGPNCDIPESVWAADNSDLNFTLRNSGRRVVMGLVVDHELEMMEIRVRQLYKLVDVFVILESNVTEGGDPKPLYFFNALRHGYLCEFQDQILYVFMQNIPEEFVQDGWMADEFIRNAVGQSALARISNLQEDDLFLSFDADEIPTNEVVLFLKFHEGFSNPIEFNLRWTVYKFFWAHAAGGETMSKIMGGSTINYLKDVCDGNAYHIRNRFCSPGGSKWNEYEGPKNPDYFKIGISHKYAGYHCSWCLTPEGISVKLQSAIHQDFPRWGDYPEKLDIKYLTNLTQTGYWFDGSRPLTYVSHSEDFFYAPDFVLRNAELYKHLLFVDT